MKWSLAGCLIVLSVFAVGDASAEWHSGNYSVTKEGKKVETQEFKLTRSEESGRLFMASKNEGVLSGGRLSVALQMEADGSFIKYNTALRKKKGKPIRGIVFLHKGKIRSIPIKGKTKAKDFVREPVDLLVMDGRTLAFWNLVGMRTLGKVGKRTASMLNCVDNSLGSLTMEVLGSGGVQWKGKFKEIQRIGVGGSLGDWTLLVDKAGKVLGGQGEDFEFVLEGVDATGAYGNPTVEASSGDEAGTAPKDEESVEAREEKPGEELSPNTTDTPNATDTPDKTPENGEVE